MESVKLTVQPRQRTGKGAARQLRRTGQVPAVLYGHGANEMLAIIGEDLLRIQQSEAGENTILDLVIEDEPPRTCNAILREVQVDPVSRAPIHADFYRIVMTEAIRVTVPLEFINVPEDRLKRLQAQLAPVVREVEVECLPRDIPEVIAVDVAELEIGTVLRAEALVLPPGVTLLADPEEAVVTIEAMREEVAAEAASTEETTPEAGAADAEASAR
ncbi:MAG TPA: 50S ribosomal protein L25 [Candidatus Tectomicrobia bacterium]